MYRYAVKLPLGNFTIYFSDFLSAQSELQSENETTNGAEIIKALTVCEFSKDETRLFLQKSKRYLEMGFDHKGEG